MDTILSVQPGRTWQNLVFIMENSTDKFRGGRTYTKLCAALVRIFKITTAMYLINHFFKGVHVILIRIFFQKFTNRFATYGYMAPWNHTAVPMFTEYIGSNRSSVDIKLF